MTPPKPKPNPLSNRLEDLVQWNIRTPEWVRDALSMIAFREGLSRDQYLRRELFTLIESYTEMYGPPHDEKDESLLPGKFVTLFQEQRAEAESDQVKPARKKPVPKKSAKRKK